MTQTLRRKLIITGTGRAGTTFLVQLLTELGLETGFTSGRWGGSYHEHCRAGLEHDLGDPRAPYVVKNPDLCATLPGILARGEVVIDHALIPIRRLEDAAHSRIRVGGTGTTPGGLTGTTDESEQSRVLAERFHQLILTLAAHEVPTTFLEFPRFAQDAAYTFRALRPILPEAVTWPKFTEAFVRTSQPELIHRFEGARASDAGAPARAHAVMRRREKLARRRRWTALGSVFVALACVGWFHAARIAADADNRESAAEVELSTAARRLVSEPIDDTPTGEDTRAPWESRHRGGLFLDSSPDPRLPPRPLRAMRTPPATRRLVLRGPIAPTWL